MAVTFRNVTGREVGTRRGGLTVICPAILIWGSIWSGKAIAPLEFNKLRLAGLSDTKAAEIKGTWKVGATRGERPLVKMRTQLHGNPMMEGVGS